MRFYVILSLNDFKPKSDEVGYFRQALEYQKIFKGILNSEIPQKKEFIQAYKQGRFPPVNSVLFALSFLIFSHKFIVARFLLILISALTTFLVFHVTAKLINSHAAFYAAMIHALFPSFISFSHLLYSETVFIFFLMLIFYLAIVLFESKQTIKICAFSLALGFLVGVLLLTRESALLFAFFPPVCFAFILKKKLHKILVPLLIIFSTLITALPWKYAVNKMEKGTALSSKSIEFILYKHNNRFSRKGFMYSSNKDLNAVKRTLAKYSRKNNVTSSQAAKTLFIKEITNHFPAFVKRASDNFLLMWSFDFFPLRQIFNLGYPPLPSILVVIIFFCFLFSHIFFIFFMFIGLLAKDLNIYKKLLILSLVIIGMLPYLITISHTRYALPQIALLLPLAGLGIDKLKQSKNVLVIFSIVFIGLLAVYYYTYNNFYYNKLRPSSYYANILRYSNKLFSKIEYSEKLVLVPAKRSAGDRITIKIVNDKNYSFAKNKKIFQCGLKKAKKSFNIVSIDPESPLKLEIFSMAAQRVVKISPISRKNWQRNVDIFPGKLKIVWEGGR